MKKFFIVLLLSISFVKTYADEGMWLPMLLGQQAYNDMVKKGLKLKPEQLYSLNKASIKDAIVIFGGGCTGGLVPGLIGEGGSFTVLAIGDVANLGGGGDQQGIGA